MNKNFDVHSDDDDFIVEEKIEELKQASKQASASSKREILELPIIKNPIVRSKKTHSKKKISFKDHDLLPALHKNSDIPPAPPMNDLFKKDKVDLERDIGLDIQFNKLIRYTDYCPLLMILNHMKSLKSSNTIIKSMKFDGIECLTDLVFYLMYKYYSNDSIWTTLAHITLDGCRYITDFGIELLQKAFGQKKNIVYPSTCAGCSKIFIRFYNDYQRNDILTSKIFIQFNANEEPLKSLQSFKLIIHNTTSLNMCKLLQNRDIEHRDYQLLIEFNRMKVANFYNYWFNVFEMNVVCPVQLQSHSSLLMICADFYNDNYEHLAKTIVDKLLYYLYNNLKYLSIIAVVTNFKNENFNESHLKNNIKVMLNNIVEEIQIEENKIAKCLMSLEFQQQESFRDLIRLSFAIKEFLAKNYSQNFHLLTINEKKDEFISNLSDAYEPIFKHNGLRRIRTNAFTMVNGIIKQKKFEKRVVKFEDIIDEMFACETFDFKLLIQTKPEYSDFADHFLKQKSLLGECIYTRLENEQVYIIFDLEWFFGIVEKMQSQLKNHLHIDFSNLCYWNYEMLKETSTLDTLAISDLQQLHLILEILKNLGVTMRIENEQYDRIINPFQMTEIIVDICELWPKTLNNCFQAKSTYKFLFEMPLSILFSIQSTFLQLKHTIYRSRKALIYQEGCILTCIETNEANNKLYLCSRIINLHDHFSFDQEPQTFSQLNYAKGFLALFFEYKVVLESVLLEHNFPYKASNTPDCKIQVETNFDSILKVEEFITKPEDYFSTEHNFSNINRLTQGEVETMYGNISLKTELAKCLFKCNWCGLNDTWFRLSCKSYQKLYPFFKSELRWKLRISFSKAVMDAIDPERKSIASIFEVTNENVVFNGVDQMSPYNLNTFKMTFTSIIFADSIRFGVVVTQKSTSKRFTIFMNPRTRRLTLIEDKITSKSDLNKELNGRESLASSHPEYSVIRTQRYIKEAKMRMKKMPLKYDDQMQFNRNAHGRNKALPIDSRNSLLEEIRNFGKILNKETNENEHEDDTDEHKIGMAESWHVKSGDSMSVHLFLHDSNTCEFAFFYNNEKIGFWLIDEWNECVAHPFSSVKGGSTKLFFNLNAIPVTSIKANEFKYKIGMFLEAEKENDDSVLSPAVIDAIDEKTGKLCVKILGTLEKYWAESKSTKLHPCGYWNYVQNHIYGHIVDKPVKHGNYRNFLNPKKTEKFFHWSFIFNEKSNRLPVPLDLFTAEQHEGMILKECKIKFFPDFYPIESSLACNHFLNPRFTWNLVDLLNSNDIFQIIEYDSFQRVLSQFSGLVLQPKHMPQKTFISYPTLNILSNDLFINISCLSRTCIKLNESIGESNDLFNSCPHLLHDDGLKLDPLNNKCESKYLIRLLLTALNFATSSNNPIFPSSKDFTYFNAEYENKRLNDALKTYFRHCAYLFSLMIPQMTIQRFGSNKDLVIKEFSFLKNLNKQTPAESFDQKTNIDEFFLTQIETYKLNYDVCKFCTSLLVQLLNTDAEGSYNEICRIIDKCQDYGQITTIMNLHNLALVSKQSIIFKKELFDKIPNLSLVRIDGVKINNIENLFVNCPNLRCIELIDNGLKELPNYFDKNRFISKILIHNNPISEIPASLFCIRSLRSLTLSKLNITSLPDNFIDEEMNAIDIRYINISQTRLTKLPYDLIARNRGLEYLTFQGVNLVLPTDEVEWPNLVIILEKLLNFNLHGLLSHQEITELFLKYDYDKNKVLNYVEIQHLNAEIFEKFERLGDHLDDASHDPFGGIPDLLFKCTRLSYLDLSFQAIRKIPDAIKSLQGLKVLKLKYCILLEALSSFLGCLPLVELDLVGCVSLKTPPLEIQRRGVTSILAYLKRLGSGSVVCKRTKLMLVGLGGAGKTSLVKCLVNKTTQKDVSITTVTDGISIDDWSIALEDSDECSKLVFSVWDFAGQAVYYNTHQFFLTNRSVYLIVWSCRLGSEHAGLEFWLNSITCHAPLSPIFIVGTHIDEVSKYELPVEALKKRYPSIAGFHFVSCFDGTNVEQLANEIKFTALSEKYMGEKIPECWLQFENELKVLKRSQNLIEFNEILPIGLRCGIFEQNELHQAIQFLHDLGSLLHFNNEFLKSKVVINPQYIVDLMSCLVSIKNNYIIDGKLNHDDIGKIWSGFDVDLHSWIIKLTEKFDLTFRVPNMNINLVPCLMSDSPSENLKWPRIDEERLINTRKKEITILYNFDYLPPGLFNRVQVRLFQISDIAALWKKGSLLKKNNHLGLIHKKDNRIELKVQGVSPENVLFLIHEVLEAIVNESFNGVRYDFSFPCPDCIDACSIDVEKSMFNASLVRRACEMKAAFLQCRQHFHAISLTDLHARFPPNSVDNYDLQLKYSIRDLKNLKEKISYDVVIVYSHKDVENESILHPRRIKIDLENVGYTIWFSENQEQLRLQSLALILRSAHLILFCMSDNFVEAKDCSDIFHYVKSILAKPYTLVALGQSLTWLTSSVGALVSHEYFIKINTIERYATRSQDLIEVVRKKVNDAKQHKNKKNSKKAQCFISYCHSNSHDAIGKGTPLKNELSLGWADPRSLKSFLENEGYTVWIDYEQIGSKNTLFEDIVDGIRNSKVIIACISNDYAMSESCMKEFRFSSNLKIPIVLCTFGSPNAKAEWKNTELGIISCLINREINFQLENPYAYAEVIQELKEKGIEPIDEKKSLPEDHIDTTSEQQNESLETAYSELFEVTQRRILRQLASYSDSSSKPFPRLFVIDLIENEFKNILQGPTSFNPNQKASKRLTRRLSIDDHTKKICIKALCEYEGGWHVTGDSIEYSSLTNIPESHYAYWLRLMTLVKHSHFININLLYQTDTLNELLSTMDDRLASFDDAQSSYQTTSMKTPSRYSQQPTTDLKQSYSMVKTFVIRTLSKSSDNSNYIEKFDLNRCSTPSGKILWLCAEHRQDENIQIFKNDFVLGTKQHQADDEFNTILLDQFRKISKMQKIPSRRLSQISTCISAPQ